MRVGGRKGVVGREGKVWSLLDKHLENLHESLGHRHDNEHMFCLHPRLLPCV